jgi:hypothetical protein
MDQQTVRPRSELKPDVGQKVKLVIIIYGWVGHVWPKKCNRRNHHHCHRLQNL